MSRSRLAAERAHLGARKNLLLNGGFSVWQRGTSITSSTTPANSDDTYIIDRWLLLSEGNNRANFAKAAASDTIGSGYCCKATQVSGAQFALVQPMYNVDSIPLRGRKVSLSARMKCGSGDAVSFKLALFSWTGTADAITSDLISAWASTLTPVANWELISETDANVLTSDWTTYTLENVTIPAGCNNLAVVLYATANIVASDETYVKDVQLEVGSDATDFEVRLEDFETTLCGAHYQEGNYRLRITSSDCGSNAVLGFATFVQKMSSPTITLGASPTFYGNSNGVVAGAASSNGFIVTINTSGAGSTTAGASFTWTAEAEL
jgi:hypothetical protein